MYESFYKLRAKPFRLSPDSGFFYPSRGHKRALAYLRYGLSQGEGFVVITGAPGTGKTTLAQILLKEMDQRHLVVAHLTTTQLEADEMLRMVAASFGLRYDGMDKAGLLKTLEAFLMARSREKKRALLVVDEAQNLPARSLEELRMLSNLQVGDRALLQTFMLGQPQFRQMLEHPDLEQLRQRVIANYHLSPLATDECRNYVESRLTQVGWQNDPSFTQQAYDTIYEFSEGIPRRINMLCDRVLLFSFLEELHEVNNAVLQQVTDELGQEISGRTLPAEPPAEGLLHPTEPEPEVTAEPLETPMTEEAASPTSPSAEAVAEDEVIGHEAGNSAMDKSAKLDAALQEQQQQQTAPEAAESFTDSAEAQEENEPSEVYELASAEPSLLETSSESPVSTGDSGDGGLDRVVPDDGWNQPQVLVDPAESAETEDEGQAAVARSDTAAAAELPDGQAVPAGQTDRFRVISGGRGSVEKPADPLVLAPLPDAPGDSEAVTIRKILRLVLAFHRSPRSFPGLDDPTQPLPRGVRNILQLAIAEDDVLKDLRQISVMGISPAMLRAAVRFFVRRVMFVPGGDDYRVLGLHPGAPMVEIELHYGLLMRLLRHDNAEVVDGGVARVGDAYERLCQGRKAAVTGDADVPAEETATDSLDLDVAPKVDSSVEEPNHNTVRRAEAYVEVDETNTAALFRNVILVAVLVVVLLVLYVTQVRGLGNREAAPAAVIPPPTAPTQPLTQGPVDRQPSSLETRPVKGDAIEAAVPVTSESSAEVPVVGEPVVEVDADIAMEVETVVTTEPPVAVEAKAAEAERAAAQLEAEARKQAEEQARAEAKAAAERKAREAERREAERRKAEARVRKEAEARAAAARKAAKTQVAAEQGLAKANAPVQVAAATSPVAAKNTASPALSKAVLEQVLTHFSNSYEKGDLNALMGLFSAKARTDTQTTSKGIRDEYADIFSTSDRRTIGFTGVSWKHDESFARGRGKFQATILRQGASAPVLLSGKVTIQVVAGDSGPQISRLYFSETRTVEGSASTEVARETLSEADLNHLMSALVTYYEAGDINAFMDLFSRDASSNDRSTALGIRKDYEGLFANTFARQMELRNLTWRMDGGIARGETDYRVTVRPERDVDAVVYNGTLWVQVESRNGLARITHLAFVE